MSHAAHKYKAFISYSHRDEKWARWLHRSLESYQLPSSLRGGGPAARVLSPIFRDRDDLASSPDLSERIVNALGESDNLIVICSPASAQSPWVRNEIETFKALGRSSRIFCLIVDGDPVAKGSALDCFAPPLRQHYSSDGEPTGKEVEPVAADLRHDADGRNLARVKLIAGLLDLDLDALRRRETQRRHRRLWAITAVSLCSTVLMAALAINAVLAREEARQRRQQAENLLAFMVGDLRDSLAPLGQLQLLEAVGDRATAYFRSINIDLLTDAELTQQAKVITQIGEIHSAQLEYEKALAAFTDAYQRSALLATSAPGDGARLFNRGQAEFWVGYIHWMQGDLVLAEEWLVQYLDTSRSLAHLDADNADWQLEEAFGHHNLGALAVEQNDATAALAQFHDALEIYDKVSAMPGKRDLSLEIADVSSFMGTLTTKQGALEEALQHHHRTVAAYRTYIGANPEDKAVQSRLGWALVHLSSHYLMMGQVDRAAAIADEIFRLHDKLVSLDESNLFWLADKGKARLQQAKAEYARGNPSRCNILSKEAQSILEALVAGGHTDRYTLLALAETLILRARLGLDSGAPEQALPLLTSAEKHLQTAWDNGWQSERMQGANGLMLVLRAEARLALNAPDEARLALQQAAAAVAEEQAPGTSIYLLDPRTRYLALSGDNAGAQKTRAALEAMGYHPVFPWPSGL